MERPFSHIKTIIENKSKVATVPVVAAAAVAVGSEATGNVAKSAGGVTKAPAAIPGAAAGGRRSATAGVPRAASSSSSSSAQGGAGPAVTRSSSASSARPVEDVSTIADVQNALAELFEQNSPEFYLGDCRDVIGQHKEWEGKITLVLLDPPFGVFVEDHDVKIPANDILRLCEYVLKPQGGSTTYYNNAVVFNNLYVCRDSGDILFRCNDKGV